MKPPKRLFKNRPTPYDPDDRRFVARHEAGHAVSAVVLGLNLRSVDLKRRTLEGGTISGGFTDIELPNPIDVIGKGEEVVMPHVIFNVAGPIAEKVINERLIKTNADEGDLRMARIIAALAIREVTTHGGQGPISPDELERNKSRLDNILSGASQRAGHLVEAYTSAIDTVAKLLLERGELSGAEVGAIVAVKL